MFGIGGDLAKIEDRKDGGDCGRGAVCTEKDGRFGHINLLTRPANILVKTIENGGGFRGFGHSKDHEVVRKKEMRYRGCDERS